MQRQQRARVVLRPRVARLAAVVLLVFMAGSALTPQPASALIRSLSREQLKDMCQQGGGVLLEWGDGSYECYGPHGYMIHCEADGACWDYCYVDQGCTCQDWMQYCINAKPLPDGDRTLGDIFQEASAGGLSPTSPAQRPGPVQPQPTINAPNANAPAQDRSSGAAINGNVTVNLLGCISNADLSTATYDQLTAACQQPLTGVPIGLAHLDGSSGTIETRQTSTQPPYVADFDDVAAGTIRLAAAYVPETAPMVAFCGVYAPPEPGPTSFTRFPVSREALETSLTNGQSLYCDWFVGTNRITSGSGNSGAPVIKGSGPARIHNQSSQAAGTPIAATPAP